MLRQRLRSTINSACLRALGSEARAGTQVFIDGSAVVALIVKLRKSGCSG
jgi:hypothetical protein